MSFPNNNSQQQSRDPPAVQSPSFFHKHAFSSTPYNPSQLVFALSPLPDHSCPISRTTPTKSDKSWWSSSWQTTPRRLSALGADRDACVFTGSTLQQQPSLNVAETNLAPASRRSAPLLSRLRPARQHSNNLDQASPPRLLQAYHSSRCPLGQHRPFGNPCDHCCLDGHFTSLPRKNL